jgi:hypothetical protein
VVGGGARRQGGEHKAGLKSGPTQSGRTEARKGKKSGTKDGVGTGWAEERESRVGGRREDAQMVDYAAAVGGARRSVESCAAHSKNRTTST